MVAIKCEALKRKKTTNFIQIALHGIENKFFFSVEQEPEKFYYPAFFLIVHTHKHL